MKLIILFFWTQHRVRSVAEREREREREREKERERESYRRF
mgnify:CR=1 FL=1